jgi:hypothetical protein
MKVKVSVSELYSIDIDIYKHAHKSMQARRLPREY